MAEPVRTPPQYPIESVGNALRLLMMFKDKPFVRLADARDELGVAHSTAHRLMSMLVHYDFVRQDHLSKAYVAGPALVDIGLSVVRAWDIRATARDLLERLRDEMHETAHLAELDGPNVRYLDSAESDMALRVASRTGSTLPAYATSIGKAMLAQLSLEELRALYPKERLPEQPTSKTLVSRAKLEEELVKVRKRGYATNASESADGVSSVGVAVVHPTRRMIAGLSLAAPVGRMSPSQVRPAAAKLTEAARELSLRLI
ncbi:IclR family transcriptional regulator [Acidothermaceae bacterium B102]|nr:IclR family transcriptional regulator [Acidothermaceae bacterium B102]